MGRKNNRRSRKDRMREIQAGMGMIIPFSKDDHHWTWEVGPDKIHAVADQIFGGHYYCIGDRKKAGKSIENPED